MALNVLGSGLRTSDFSSNNSLADISSCSVTFTLLQAATVLVMARCRAIYIGDEVAGSLDSEFSYAVDGTDKSGVLINYEINGSETGQAYIPACFWALESLAAGTHTIKLRGKTQNGTVTGAIVNPIEIAILG